MRNRIKMKSGRSQRVSITIRFWPFGSCCMGLLPEGFMLFVFLTWIIMFAFWKKSISGFCMGSDFFRKNDYHKIFWRWKKYFWWESSCFFGRSGGRWSHGSQRFLRENLLLRDHVRFFHEIFIFFCYAKRLPFAFFWFFCFFYMGFTMFATFRRFWGLLVEFVRLEVVILELKFQKKMRSGFFSQKKYVRFFMKIDHFIKILWNS